MFFFFIFLVMFKIKISKNIIIEIDRIVNKLFNFIYWELFYRFVNIFDFVISFFVKCSLGMLKWGGVKWVVLYIFFLVIGFLVFYIGD